MMKRGKWHVPKLKLVSILTTHHKRKARFYQTQNQDHWNSNTLCIRDLAPPVQFWLSADSKPAGWSLQNRSRLTTKSRLVVQNWQNYVQDLNRIMLMHKKRLPLNLFTSSPFAKMACFLRLIKYVNFAVFRNLLGNARITTLLCAESSSRSSSPILKIVYLFG